MMLHIALVAEILATVICIHCIYGRRFKLDISTIGLVLSVLVILELINWYRLNGILSCSIYIALFIYCRNKFKHSIIDTIISILLYIIILTSIQFICMFLTNFVMADAVYVRNSLGNLLALIIFIILLPTNVLHRLQKSMCRNRKILMVLLGFMGIVVLIIVLQGKAFYEVQMQYFILAVPAIIMLLYLILKWYSSQVVVERMEEELRIVAENTKEYDSLLTKVRLRQHEFKNHIAAIFSAHYTHKTYEKLVQAQEEYCKQLMDENKYNNLLLLGNNILAGYLYGKFQEAEADEIEIDCIVSAKMDKCRVPTYHVIEMLGILFDNAVEAQKADEEKKISLEISDVKDAYQIIISVC